ncbi:sulfate/molybdate ABC transporter ATP-binding protein [Frigoriflavimonas asaccharolytica]|uniref:ABC-type sulfate/molybdate transport systems ATPase subunit n=1 Tax=Frigoriflavimonas asaccharolytica TaxID=2735899 RepID=A0A8J8KBW5_9FLAO|nr:ABC transporter ATP-binding protein [Frigoriflavimonas asaccharolytica]NRS92989.1 ABC-type sulfate/molybdate transport systems ATPase subunit [Frigoriflavimonas asaccharolytica]
MLLELNKLHFSYTQEKKLFNNINLKVDEGRIVALAGESGCGKSTLLKLIYGLLDWQEGDIMLDAIKLQGPKGNIVPGEENIKLVAQDYDLMPYATVAENVGKFISNIHLVDKNDEVAKLLDVVGMQDFANELPKNLSGGQQQRIAIARALSVMPKLLLLDEPFSNIDFSRKIILREKLFNYVKEKNISLIISTHEILEVMPWLDELIVLQEGRLIQKDKPEEIFKNPYNSYVSALFGEVNILSDEEKILFNLHKNSWYPHEISVVDDGFPAEVLESRFSGSFFWNKIKIENRNLIIYTNRELKDEKIQLQFN